MTEPGAKGYWIDVESMRVAGNVDSKGKPTWVPQHCLPGNCVSCDADAGVSPALIEQLEADPTTPTGVGPQTFVESLGRGGATERRN